MTPRPHWPRHDLEVFKELFRKGDQYRIITRPAQNGLVDLGQDILFMEECILALNKRSWDAGHGHFVCTNNYIDVRSGNRNPQDEYNLDIDGFELYIKICLSGNPQKAAVISFKERT